MIINLTIDRFEDGKAVLLTEDNQIIIWPKDKLPDGSQEGSILIFAVANGQEKNESSRQLAKDILNEILSSD